MRCYKHPESEAIGTCTSCGKNICEICSVDFKGRLVCRDCLATGKSSGVKDPNTAFLIELIGGFLGFLGVGYLYVERTNEGLKRLVLWLAYNITAWVIITLLTAIIIGVICIPIQIVIQISVPIWSANTLKKELSEGSAF